MGRKPKVKLKHYPVVERYFGPLLAGRVQTLIEHGEVVVATGTRIG
jgi:hypothetical protein